MKKPTSIILRELDLANFARKAFYLLSYFLYEIKRGIYKAKQIIDFRNSKILNFKLNSISRISSFQIIFTGYDFQKIEQNLRNLIPVKIS